MGREDAVHRPSTSSYPPNLHHLIFSYGTLKHGFSNHTLLSDLIATHNAAFLGHYTTTIPLPLVCGPFKVPFLLNLPHLPHTTRVSGELYSLSPSALSVIDELEGVSKGHYERLPLNVVEEGGEGEVVEVEAYYAHRSYAEEMWRRSGERGFGCYTEVEAKGYVRRKDRPKGVTFLEHIRTFLNSSDASD
ncbi:hypothetical protein LIER_14717 [Lithospermum erythrorhizon]|uniref:Gamma-glutamylcyclotransferase family protein n=1 Tax=Lithospermum erythrorhizon TaxID=34254 RepID=A0AAV3Q2Q3_LITER